MTEEEVKDLFREASEKIKEDFIPAMTNLLMDVFQHGINKGTEIGLKIGTNTQSNNHCTIHWQTGEPKENSICLVTTSRNIVTTSYWINGCWLINDLPFSTLKIKAWCKLSDIEPYKEETK